MTDKTKRLDSARGPILGGLAIMAVFFGGAGYWATTAPLNGAVVGPGVIVVDSNRKAVQHLTGGIIEQIAVRDGQTVQAGDVLLRLDGTQARAERDLLEGEYWAMLALQARLSAERDGRTTVLFPDALLDRAEDDQVADSMTGQLALFDSRRKSLTTQEEILKGRIVQYERLIDGLKAQVTSYDKQEAFIADELAGKRKLYKDGHETKPRLLALEREAAELAGQRGKLEEDIARTELATSETRLQIQELAERRRTEVVAELREVQDKVFDLSERLRAARHAVRHLEIAAPQSGRVVGLAVHTEGGVIKPGDTLMEIVPDDDTLVVEARLRPEDVNDVQPGMGAEVALTAFNQRTTGKAKAEVLSVSADRLVDQATGQPFFQSKLAVSVPEGVQLAELSPGMPAVAYIQTKARTALDYILEPLSQSLDRAFKEE